MEFSLNKFSHDNISKKIDHKIILYFKRKALFGQMKFKAEVGAKYSFYVYNNEILGIDGGEYTIEKNILTILSNAMDISIRYINRTVYVHNYSNIHEEIIATEKIFPKIVNHEIRIDFHIVIEKRHKYTVIVNGEFMEKKEAGNKYEIYRYTGNGIQIIMGTFNILEIISNKYIHFPMFLFNNKTKELYKKYAYSVERLKDDMKKISRYFEDIISMERKFSFVFSLSIDRLKSHGAICLIPFCQFPIKNDLPQLFKFKKLLFEGYINYIFYDKVVPIYHDKWIIKGLREYFKLYLIKIFFGEDEYYYRRKKIENFIIKNDVIELSIYDKRRSEESYESDFVRYKSMHILFILESNMSFVFMEKILREFLKNRTISSECFLNTINQIVGKSFKRIFYVLLLKPGAVISNVMISLNANKNQVSVRINQKGTSLFSSGNRKLYGFLPITSIESDVEYDHMFDFFGNSDFTNANNRKNENILRFNYHIRTKRLRGSVSNYLLATNQLKENNEISFLYLRIDENRNMYSKYIVNNIKGGLKESIDDRSIYIQLDAIEGIIREINADRNEDNIHFNYSLRVIELFDNLEQKLFNDNTYYKIKMEILRFFAEYDYQRVINYMMKFINGKNETTIIRPNNFHKEDMRIFEYLGSVYMYMGEENTSIIVNCLLEFLKYNDNSYNEYSDSLLIGNMLFSLFKFSDSKNIGRIVEILNLIFKSDFIFKSARNLHSISAINLASILYLRGQIAVDARCIFPLISDGNLMGVRLAALDFIFILSKDDETALNYIDSILKGRDIILRDRLIENYFRFFEAGFDDYIMNREIMEDLHNCSNEKLIFLNRYYTGDYLYIKDYENELKENQQIIAQKYAENHEKDEHKTDMDDFISIIKIQPFKDLTIKLKNKAKRKSSQKNPKKVARKQKVQKKADSEEDTYLSELVSSEMKGLKRAARFYRSKPVKKMRIKIKYAPGISILRIKK